MRLRNGSKARDSRQEDYLLSMDASTQDKIEDHKRESELQIFLTDGMKLFFAACVSVTNAFLICWLRFQCFLHLFRPITKCFEADIQRSYMSSFFNFLPKSVDFSMQMIFSLQLPNV